MIKPIPKAEYKVFIGGLSEFTTRETVFDYFSNYGEVYSVYIMYDKLKRSRCFGFISFANKETVEEILKYSHMIDSKFIECKPAQAKSKRESNENEETKEGYFYKNKIFVGGIADLTEKDIINYFSQIGKVNKVVIMKDNISKLSRGFGFVSFEEDSSIDKVLYFRQHYIKNNLVECKRSYIKNSLMENQIDSREVNYSLFYNSDDSLKKGLWPVFEKYNKSDDFINDLTKYFTFKLFDKNAKPFK